MADRLKRIPFGEFSNNLALIIDRVIHEHETVLVKSESGRLVEVKPAAVTKSHRRTKTKEDYKAFLTSFGSWEDVDVDSFLKENYASRNISTRDSVEL